jgi:hypothetical protein
MGCPMMGSEGPAVFPAALQVTFSLPIVLQTFFSPVQGWLVDRFGPRRLKTRGRYSHKSGSLTSQLHFNRLSARTQGDPRRRRGREVAISSPGQRPLTPW